MGLLEAICKELEDDATVAAQVSDRIWLNYAPASSVLPYIVVRDAGGPGAERSLNPAADVPGFANDTVDISCFDTTPELTRALAKACYDVLDDFTGTLGSGSHTIVIERLTVSTPVDRTLAPIRGKNRATYQRSLNCNVWCRRTSV